MYMIPAASSPQDAPDMPGVHVLATEPLTSISGYLESCYLLGEFP